MFTKKIIFILLFLFYCLALYSEVTLYFQKALTARVLSNPIIDEKSNTITVLTKDKWLSTYTMDFKEKYSYRLDRTPYPYLTKDFDDGYYVVTVKNEVQKISKGKLIWKHRLKHPPIKGLSIGTRYILIPLADETIVALSNEDGDSVFNAKIGGKPVNSPVVLENGNFYVISENNSIFAFDSWGMQKWAKTLPSLPLSIMISTDKSIIVGHRSGHIITFDSDTGVILNSINLYYPINFLFEKLNGNYIAISADIGKFFNLTKKLKNIFMKNLKQNIKEAVLYDNKSLFLIVGKNEVFVLDKDFNFKKKDNIRKKVLGVSANSGIIAVGRSDWILTTYYYPYSEKLNVSVWNHIGGNSYNQNRIGLEKFKIALNDKTYLLLNEMLDLKYNSELYSKFLDILSSVTVKFKKQLPEEYLNIYKKALNNWLIPTIGTDRIIQRGEIYKYFSYIDNEISIKNFIYYALKERNIDNVIKIVKNIAKFENYHDQDILVFNYIKYVAIKYQGNLEVAYAVILNLKKLILNSNEKNLFIYKDSYIDLLKLMRRQNFSENINEYIDEIIRDL